MTGQVRGVGLVVLAALIVGGRETAADDAAVEKVRSDWLTRLTRTNDVSYDLDGEVIAPKGTLILAGDETAHPSVRKDGYPPEDLSHETSIKWFLDFRSHLLRHETFKYVLHTGKLEFKEEELIEGFDGETLWTARKDEKGAIALQPSERASWFLTASSLPVFFAHGVFPLGSFEYADLASQSAESLTMESEGQSIVEGRTCEVIRVRPKRASRNNLVYRFHVDLDRNSSVLRFTRHSAARSAPSGAGNSEPVLVTQIDIEIQEVDGFWVPARWTKNSFSAQRRADGSPWSFLEETVKLSVTEVGINEGLKRDLFSQPRSPGKLILDQRDGTRYRVASDGKSLTPLRQSLAQDDSGSIIYWVGIGFVGIVFVAAGAYLFRRSARA